MLVSTVNKLNIYTVNKRRVEKDGFGAALSALVNPEELRDKVRKTMEHKGRVYGIYREKALVGIYIFERFDDFFVRGETTRIRMGDKEIDLDDTLFGENTAAFCLAGKYLLEEVKSSVTKIEKVVRGDLSEQIEWGQIAGFEFDGELVYRRNIKQGKNTFGYLSRYFSGYLLGFAIGMMFGWLAFDSLLWGIALGASQAVLWSSILTTSTKTEEGTCDLVNEKYHTSYLRYDILDKE